MAMPINIASYLLPREGTAYYLLEDKYIKGGFSVVPTIAERDNIFDLNLKVGAHVFVVETEQTFRLKSADPVEWEETSLTKKITKLTLPYDLTFGAFSSVLAGSIIGGVVLNRDVQLSQTAANIAVCETAPKDGPAAFNIVKNSDPTPIGTVTFAQGATVGVFVLNETTLLSGDRLRMIAQSVFDSSIDQIMITIAGSSQVRS